MWGYLDDFTARLRHIPSFETLDLSDLLNAVFPDLHSIWITRWEKVRQAISHWKAIQTGLWGLTEGEVPRPGRKPAYDFDAIDYLVMELHAHDAAWSRYFAGNRIQPLIVVYEEFMYRYEETILETLQFLGILAPTDLGVSKRRMRKQAVAVSDVWAQWYLSNPRRSKTI